MAFFLIVPSVIVVTIFLVHSVAERLGFRVKYFSLILCAVMSVVINFAAIKISDYLDKWHYVRIGILVLVSSFIVTLVNRYLIRHDKTDVIIIDEETTLKEAEEEEKLEKLEEETAKDTSNDNSKEANLIKSVKEDKKSDVAGEKSETADKTKTSIKTSKSEEIKPILKTPVIEKKITSDNATDTNKPVKPKEEAVKKSEGVTPVKPKEVIPKKSEAVTSVKPKEAITKKTEEIKPIKPSIPPKPITNKTDTKKIEGNKLTASTDTKTTIAKSTLKVDDKSAPKISDKPKIKDNEVKSTVDKPKDKIVDDKLADINSHLGSLDDILDYAYSQKSKGNINQAVLAYQKALDRYKNDDYAPFIAIDLGNIYKEQPAYSKVIKTYEEALKLPVVMRNANTRKEFTKNLNYMRMVQTVLIRHRALTTPFSKIPLQYLQEVEAELKSIQLNTSSSRRNF